MGFAKGLAICKNPVARKTRRIHDKTMPPRRPAPRQTAAALIRRHGDFAVHRVVEQIRQGEAEGRADTAWWHSVLEAIWTLTAGQGPGDASVH